MLGKLLPCPVPQSHELNLQSGIPGDVRVVVDNLLGAWCDTSLGAPSHAGILVEAGPEPPSPHGFLVLGEAP